MNVQVLNCPNCGAGLEVYGQPDTLRCKFCGSNCRVEGDGESRHLDLISAKLDELTSHAENTAEELARIRAVQGVAVDSQLETDDAVRRAAYAQELAAHEQAQAARVTSAIHEASIDAANELNQAALVEENRALSLHASFEKCISVMAWAITPVIITAIVLGIWFSGSWFLPESGFLTFLAVLFIGLLVTSPVWGIAHLYKIYYGRRFNEIAYLYGLPEVNVKSKAQADLDRELKKLGDSGKANEWLGCGFVILVLVVGGIWKFKSGSSNEQDSPSQTPSQQPDNSEAHTPAMNSPQNSNSPADADSNEPASNSAERYPNGGNNEKPANAPNNSPEDKSNPPDEGGDSEPSSNSGG